MVAELLADGKIVGWFQGRMESGPRALGNRSILMSPDKPENKDLINKSVKFRESFRPFAATVIEEYAKDWFELDKIDISPHMMYAVNAKKETLIDALPQVISARNQSLIETNIKAIKMGIQSI